MLALRIYYDGSRFHGFQRQPHTRTIEGEILRVLAETRCLHGGTPDEALYSAAGRTDRGVHSAGQTVSFLTSCPLGEIIEAINAELAPEIIAWAARDPAPAEFNARYWAVSRTYAYVLRRAPGEPLLTALLHRFLGTRKYPVQAGDPYRRITGICVAKLGFPVLLVTGDSFVRRQVRRIASIIEDSRWGAYLSYRTRRPGSPDRLVFLGARYPLSFKPIDGGVMLLRRAVCGKKSHAHRFLCKLLTDGGRLECLATAGLSPVPELAGLL